MAVTGAILGDIIGSRFEFDRCRDWRNAELFTEDCSFTDDTIMTLAVKRAIIQKEDLTAAMREIGRQYRGYGPGFKKWIFSDDAQPYNSYGNGAAMRVSFVAEYGSTLEEVVSLAEKTAMVSHNHPEGVKGAVTTAVCIWKAKHGCGRQEIYDYVLEQYPPEVYPFSIDKTVDDLEANYKWDVSCMTCVPVAMRCFYESDSFEGFMRNVIRLDCDTDTIGAIGGAVAEEFYRGTGFDAEVILKKYLDEQMYRLWKLSKPV